MQLKHVAQLVHLYPAAVAWQHVAVPRAKTPGAPGSTPRRDLRLLLEVNHISRCSREPSTDWDPAEISFAASQLLVRRLLHPIVRHKPDYRLVTQQPLAIIT